MKTRKRGRRPSRGPTHAARGGGLGRGNGRRVGDADEAVVKILRKADKPVVLAANKVDDARTEAEAYGRFWAIGLPW